MTQETHVDVQSLFIQAMKQASAQQMNLADELSDVLQISADSAYRRLRGETAFSLNEAATLCQHFGIPLESLISSNAQSVMFNTAIPLQDPGGFTQYLQGLGQGIAQVADGPSAEIVYAGEDLPVFYSLMLPSLARFKMCYWSKSILNIPDMQRKRVEEVELPEEWKQISTKIKSLFLKVNSIEIWNQDTLKSTLEQFRYYWESGFFAKAETALQVLNDIKQLVSLLELQAEHGKKVHPDTRETTPTDFAMYASDLMIGNNCVQVKAHENVTSYIGYNTFNYMFTHDKGFNTQIDIWLKNLIAKSTLISKVGEKQRHRFFNAMNREVERLIEQVKGN